MVGPRLWPSVLTPALPRSALGEPLELSAARNAAKFTGGPRRSS